MKRFSDILKEARKAKHLQEDQLHNTNSEDEDYEFSSGVLVINKDSSLASKKQKLLEYAAAVLNIKGSDVFLFTVWIER